MQIISSITRQTSQGTRATVATSQPACETLRPVNEALAQFARQECRRERQRRSSGPSRQARALALNPCSGPDGFTAIFPQRKRDHDDRTPGPAPVDEHELSELRMLIERAHRHPFRRIARSFFLHARPRILVRREALKWNESLRRHWKTNLDTKHFLSACSLRNFVLPLSSVTRHLKKPRAPELHTKSYGKIRVTLRVWSAGCSTAEEPYRSRSPLPTPCLRRYLARDPGPPMSAGTP